MLYYHFLILFFFIEIGERANYRVGHTMAAIWTSRPPLAMAAMAPDSPSTAGHSGPCCGWKEEDTQENLAFLRNPVTHQIKSDESKARRRRIKERTLPRFSDALDVRSGDLSDEISRKRTR